MRQELLDIDRGWAWVALTAAYLGVIITSTTLYMNGVLYVALLDRYQEGEVKTSLVGALSTGLQCFAAPLGSVINNKYSCRSSLVMGGVLSTMGIAMSAFVPNIDWMFVTFGILTGLGYGMCTAGYVSVVGLYFKKWRDVVLSLCLLTAGIAMFIAAPLGLYLIDNFGLTETFLIIAGIQLHMCVIGMICKPSVVEIEIQANRVDGTSKEIPLYKRYLDLSLPKNVRYMFFLCSTATWNFSLSVSVIHLPNYLSLLGGSDADITYMMSSFSIANTIGRLSGSIALSILRHKSIHAHVGALALSGIMSSLFPLYSRLTGGVYLFTIPLGFCTGLPNALMMPLSLRFVNITKLSDVLGFSSVFCGIGVSSGPVIIGYLNGILGSYENSFLVIGAILILGSIFSATASCHLNGKR